MITITPYEKAEYILSKIKDLTEDELHFVKGIKENVYFGSPTSARSLHELEVLYLQAQGFARAEARLERIEKAAQMFCDDDFC